jgi:putative DNA primase/helicase
MSTAATLDDVRKVLVSAQEAHGQEYAQSLPEQFGDEGATISTLTDEQRTALVGYCRAEERKTTDTGLGAVPTANHLCTDLANANRLSAAFGKRLIAVGGVFYAWSGTHWARDDGEAHRCAAQLSAIVAKEAKKAAAEYSEATKTPEGEALVTAALKHPRKSDLGKSDNGRRLLDAQAKADMLRAWGAQCEMKARQDAALGLLRNMLTLETSRLDSDPWLFNCESGTIDLRTGSLKQPDPADYITRCAPVRFNPNATAPNFERFVLEIVGGDEAVYRFLRRWFGYACTGDIREDSLLIHVGKGANGKSTLLDAISDVFGSYAGAAPPGLLADSGRGSDRHPTEIASLRGLRMVTAHESDDSATLRSGFVKQMTGGDTLSARVMRGDFFEFKPTHKLQMLTNCKPSIRGQDFGMWRRILTLNYPIKFGSQDDIDAGEATRLKDLALPGKLLAEREGIFAWLIRGAVEWQQTGLVPPDAVIAASREYKNEQDRIGIFIKERCVRDPKAWVSFTGGDGREGLYTTYQWWCKENGFSHLAITKFLDEAEQSVPGFQRTEIKIKDSSGRRKTVRGATGLRLDIEQQTEFPSIEEEVKEAQPPEPPPAKAKTAAPLPKPAPKPDPTALRQHFMTQLEVDADVADILVREKFLTVEDVTAATNLTGIKEFDEDIVKELQARALRCIGGNYGNA